MRIEYQLGLTLAASFVIVLSSFLLKLVFLPNPAPQDFSSTVITGPIAQVLPYKPSAYPMTPEEYLRLYKQSLNDPSAFWGKVATDQLSWIRPFGRVYEPGQDNPFDGFKWFPDGSLNACYNAVDRHAVSTPDKIAVIWESDNGCDQTRKITYSELHKRVKQVASYLKSIGVKKGDVVTIYMPVLPETVYAMLGCARIGAIHNVVFAGFGWESLRDRINDAKSRVLLTCNEGRRGGKIIEFKKVVDKALIGCPGIEKAVVLSRSSESITVMTLGRDVWWHESISVSSEQCPLEEMNAEDPLFILYTSGSTGKPKALLHTTGGYLAYASYTHKVVFGYRPEDVYFCTADFGWITGHSYVVYGPLINNGTTLIFEGLPTHPSPSRLWEIVNKHQVRQFYTAPTLIRSLKRLGDENVLDCPSLKVIGSVGEPIDAKSWHWYHDVVGKGRCNVVDTYWQTETGGHLICTIPGAAPVVPGYAGLPLFGIDLDILPIVQTVDNETSGSAGLNPLVGTMGALVVKRPWPGMARTVWGDHARFIKTYLSEYERQYYTGDGATRDIHGNYMIHGRIDDVINVSGHRIATAEVEGVLTKHSVCSEAAVLGKPDDITGFSIAAFCLLKPSSLEEKSKEMIVQELKDLVRSHIGPFACPRHIFFPSDLPKTRSGKIMRRVLRKILANEEDLGDLSTLTNPALIDELIQMVRSS